MSRTAPVVMAVLLSACAGHDQVTALDTRAEHVDHQRLQPNLNADGGAALASYQLAASEGYRMPRLHTAPPPVLGTRDPRQSLPPTRVCLQVVVDAAGRVERSLPLTDRTGCEAGGTAENSALLQAAQEAVAQWAFAPAALCHFGPGKAPRDAGDCEGADRIEPIPVSLLYAFTFEIVEGQQRVRSRKGDGGN